ncbi:MAG: hypothetical protein M3Y93_07730, partial [Pseudomonadota bacterium]|nr:hypothetical protein [Pseudomonadota bacterium]
MNPRLAFWFVRLYPRGWRKRYGEEFEALLQSGSGDLRTSANVVWSALSERVRPTSRSRLAMNQYPGSVMTLAKFPSAFIPMVMSLTA